MLTPDQLFGILAARPFPGAVDLRMTSGACCFTVEGVAIGYTHNGWLVFGRVIPDEWPIPLDFVSDAERVHAEIRRVLAIVNAPAEPSPTWAEIKADCVGPDLPADDPLYDRATAAQALAKVTAERDALLIAESTLSKIAAALAIPALEPYDDALSMVKRLVVGYTVVSQRLAGSQKEVAEVSAERDEATARATKAEARVKRLRKSINAAHDVLDEAGIGLEPEGSPRWTLARRCRAAVAPVWGYLDAMQAFDVVGEIVGVTGKTGERGFIDAVIARVKALHQAYTTLAALLFADHSDPAAVVKALHALNNRIKVYEVTEEQWEADNATSVDLERLVNYHQAPVKFADRPLTLAERAAFVIRRLWQGRANAANEAASLRRELSDIADALSDLPDTAEREPIGDREEHLGLSTAERIRLTLAK